MVESAPERFTPEAEPRTFSEFILNQANQLQDLINKPIHEYLDTNQVW